MTFGELQCCSGMVACVRAGASIRGVTSSLSSIWLASGFSNPLEITNTNQTKR
ncbi:MAG: hypothetical protein RR962_12995 [Hafnia sp.]